MDDRDAEIRRLQDEVNRLKAAPQDGGLSRLAAHASREKADYQRLLSGGDVRVDEIHDTAMEAATYLLADMGL